MESSTGAPCCTQQCLMRQAFISHNTLSLRSHRKAPVAMAIFAVPGMAVLSAGNFKTKAETFVPLMFKGENEAYMKLIDFHKKRNNKTKKKHFRFNLNSRLGYRSFKMVSLLADIEQVSDLGTQLLIRR